MGLDGCGKKFETWVDHSGLWREDSTFQKINIAAYEPGMDFGVQFWYEEKSVVYDSWVACTVGRGCWSLIYDVHGVMGISISLKHYEEEL